METNAYWSLLQKDLASASGYEDRLDVLRRFTRQQQSLLKDRDLAGTLPLEGLFTELSLLAEAVLIGSESVARNELTGGVAAPSGDDFAIVAMGKFGGREITYHSDLDVIFFYKNPEGQEFAARLATRIISALSIPTRSGWAYRIDAALRPSGNSGALVSSLASFREYHRDIGRTWERQALIKARPVVGPADFLNELRTAFEDISYQDYDPTAIAGEIDHLRGRMERELAKEKPGRSNVKTGRGGIVDIEFAVQYLQLIHGRKKPGVRTANTLLALAALAGEKILDPGLAQALGKAYLFYRELETRLRLALDQPADELWEGSEISQKMTETFFKGRPIFEELKREREEVRRIYRLIFGKGTG